MSEDAIREALEFIKCDIQEVKAGQRMLESAFNKSCSSQGARIGSVEKDVAVLSASITAAHIARQDEYKTLQRNVSVGMTIVTVIIIGLQFLLRLVGK